MVEPRGVDQAEVPVQVPPVGQEGVFRVADPQRPDGAVSARHVQDGMDGGGVLQVQRHLHVRSHGPIELGQGRYGGGDRGVWHISDRAPPEQRSDPAIVVQDRDAVGGAPHVALKPGGTHGAGSCEGLERVLGGMRPSAPVGEQDRVGGPFGGG